VVLLETEGGGELAPRAVRSRSGSESEVVVSQTLLSEVLATSNGVLTQDAAYDPRFMGSKTVSSARLRSAMCVPLTMEGEVRGAIMLMTRNRSGVFHTDDLEILSAIAAQASVAIENAQLIHRLAFGAATRERLARFLSPAIVEMASKGGLNLRESGELQEATILFADIRGFTAMAERMSPPSVVSLLNEHFENLVSIVFANGGVLDKFLGDSLMAIWGAPVRREDHAARALRAGLAMVERVRAMNEVRRGMERESYEIGVGVNTGPVVFGAIGASTRLELTAVGDAVNTASRLCSLALGGQVITSGESLLATGNAFEVQALPPMALKGKSQVKRAYSVLRERTDVELAAKP
jgi:adenylate cyclase